MQVKKTAIIYCRVSSLDQIEGTSLDTQEQVCREYASRQGFDVLDVFVERGESAKTADRTQLKAAIAYCSTRGRRVDYFIVYKVDRFARNMEDHVTVRMKLRQAGTTLVSATEPIDGSPAGKLLEWQMAGWAEFDNSIRAERAKQGMLARMRQGVWVWDAPLGYTRETQGANLVPHPDEAVIIRTLFTEFAKGTHTYESIARYLDQMGFRTRRGNQLRRQQTEKLLHNPIYTGVIEAWGQRIVGNFEPLVSLELWKRCQPGYRDERKPHALAHLANNPLYPLRRVVTCSRCGAPLTGSAPGARGGKHYPYYHHPRQNCSLARAIRKEHLESLFVDCLADLSPTPVFEEIYRVAVAEVWNRRQGDRAGRIRAAQREIRRLQGERQRIFQYHRAGVYTNEEFTEQKYLIDAQINGKSRLIESETAESFNPTEVLDYAFQFIRNPATTWMQLEPTYSARLRFQRLIFKGTLPFDGERFGNPVLGLIYAEFRDFQNGNTNLAARISSQWKEVRDELECWAALAQEVTDFPQTHSSVAPDSSPDYTIG